MWNIRIRGLGPSTLGKALSPVAAVGFLRSLWEKPIQECVWPHLDPMDSVCLRTASMEWNVPGKYGPHGELFFFLIQKQPAIAPNSETFSPFTNPDIRTLLFSADVLKKCALIALHVIGGRRKRLEMDFKPPSCWKNGKWAAQRVQSGRVKAKLGRKTKVCLPPHLVKATCAMVRCTSSGLHGPGDEIAFFL